jgi:DNA (cytosine-5)-methyltransferase 1
MALRSLELFAGAGGLALGLDAAGVRHSAIVEWDHDACATLRENRRSGVRPIRNWPQVLQRDVRSLDFSEFRGIDLVTGGPPCQPFSLGGKHRAYLDDRDMFPAAIGAVRITRPRAFLFENVKGLTRSAFANYFSYVLLQLEFPNLVARPREKWLDHLGRLERHKTKGSDSEYYVVHRVLDAADYGVPQRRERVFVVGIRRDIGKEFSFPNPSHSFEALLYDQWVSGQYWDDHKVSKRSRPPMPHRLRSKVDGLRDVYRSLLSPRWNTVRDAIGDLPDPENTPKSKLPQAHIFQAGARSYVGHTGSPLDEPAKALKAGDHGVPGGENMLRRRDGSVRYFTVRESARIQTFPDEYMFVGSWTETMRQLGNAVPVRLAACVAKALSDKLRVSAHLPVSDERSKEEKH